MNFARGYPDEVYSLRTDGRSTIDDGGAALDVRGIVNILWRARFAMLAGSLLGLTLAVGYVATLAPTFTATAKVLFSPDQRQVVDLKDVIVRSSLDGLQNQIEILRSAHLMRRVVERADLTSHPTFNPALRQTLGGSTAVSALIDGLFGLPGVLLSVAGLGPARAEGEEPPAPPVVVADERAARTARHILASNLRLDPVPDSRVIAISATTQNPTLSAQVVNAVANEYITAQLDAKLAATREATTWLTERVGELKDELASAEAASARAQSGLAARDGASSSQLKAELEALNKAIAAAATARSAAEIRYRAARAAIDGEVGEATSVDLQASDPIRRARERMRDLAVDRAALAQLVGPGHERLASLDAQLDAVRKEMAEEADRIALVLYNSVTVEAAKERQLRKKSHDIQARLSALDEEKVSLREHEREAEASRLIYETFLARLKETTQQEKLHEADAVVISPAERPGGPDSASGRRIAALGGAIGLMAGLAFTLILERLNNTFRALEDIEEMTGLTVVGTIPLLPDAAAHGGVLDYVMHRPNSALAESIRSLRTSLLFSHVDDPPQVVVFTSSVPAEGKSTTSLLLAVTSAQMGKSTIIVDCDLRRPTLSGMLGAVGSARGGLRAVLDGSLTLEQACLKDPETGLTILPTRVEPGAVINAADALASSRFGALLKTLRERYELVILDAPPTLSVTDARLVAQRADATFYCIKWDDTPRETVMEGLREFSIVRPNIAGAVVTMVDMSRAKRDGALYDYRMAAVDPYHDD